MKAWARECDVDGLGSVVWPGGAPGKGEGVPSGTAPSTRDRCLAEAMQGRGDASAAVEAWGAELRLEARDVTVEQKIAAGSTAEVFTGSWKGRQVAVKRLAAGEGAASLFVRELGVMSRTRHPNLVRLFGFCYGAGAFDMVLELGQGGSLFDLLYLSEVEVAPHQQLKVAGDVVKGMAYLHGLATPILHRDLKSLNILLCEPVRTPSDVPISKLADFGLAKMRLPCGEPGGSCGEAGAGASCTIRSTGTLQWMAPELMAGRNDYSLEVDVYAYGMLLYEITCFEPPFADVEPAEVRQLVLEGVRPEIDRGAMPAPLEKLTRACWAQEPGTRPSFSFLAGALEAIWHV